MMAQQANMNQQMQNILGNDGNNNNLQSSTPSQTGVSSNPQPSNQGICVIFRASGQEGPQAAPVMVQCMPDEKVAKAIEKYRNKANDHDTTKKFIFNAKNLNQSLSLSEAGIANNANIFVVTTKGVKGAI